MGLLNLIYIGTAATLSYIDAKAWKDIHGHSASLAKDPDHYGPPSTGTKGLFQADDGDHGRQRRIFSHAFSDRALKDQEPLFRGYVELLVTKLRELGTATPEAKVNMVDMYNFTTFDVMADLTFGEPLQLLKGSAYNAWVQGIFAAVKFFGLSTTLRFYFPKINAMLPYVLPVLKKKQREHMQYALDRVDRRLAADTDRPDIWSYVLREKGDGQAQLTVPEMHANATTFMIAGTETTATLLSGVTYHLLRNPDKMARLVAEIRSAFASPDDMSLQNLPQQPYLNACLEEALRIYPPVPGGLPRLTPPGGTIVCGEHVPGNVTIFVTNWAAYHSSRHFALPEQYIPERWLPDNDDPTFAADDKAILQPFSYGPRNCIGKNLAWHEMRLILSYVLWHFDLELCTESEDWTDQRVYALWEKKPLMVRLTPVERA
ncbi:cytochrome p450 [Neofusicoccum parvum]|uniref:Cytochrome p450 n=1 Tax=Neofusicoccum parvum TaxID=310453 RepID=A0ACB5S0F5_9PEZI|nr:cytochrome p450 [Neofusicoccum parvum]